MTSASIVLSVAERLETLLLADGAPARVEGDLRDRAGSFHTFLKSAAAYLEDEMKSSRSSTPAIRQEIKELAYDVEDAFECYAYWRQRGVGEGKIIALIKYYCCLTEKRLRQDLHIFQTKVDELFELLRTAAAGDAAADAGDRFIRQHQWETASHLHPGPVGVDEDAMRLMSLLVGELPPDLSVVVICGMGGIGKTTLAQHVYNTHMIVEYFHIRAWVSVSQDFQARKILESLLLIDKGKYEADAGMKTVEMIEKLYKTLSGRRYLIVLDDVWSMEVWDTLKYALPDNHNGSRIVVTSRDMGVGRSFGSAYVLQMQKLTEEQSWDMLIKTTGLADHGGLQANPDIENIGRQIVKYCGGLPLAVKSIGSILRGTDLEHWYVILHELQQDQPSVFSDIRNPLKLSYTSLPSCLKPCFLYLGNFPPDKAISVEKLYLLWMAEGLISPRAQGDRTRMEVAENHFKELVRRSLVMKVEKEGVSELLRSKSFRTHDLIRDLCISEGKQDAFFEIIDSGYENKIRPSTRRIAVYLNKCDENTKDVFSNLTKANHIRSILFFDTKESPPKPSWPIRFLDLNKFQKIRVLEFNGVYFRDKELPRGIEKLVYLRHLSFGGCYLQELPPSLSNFFFLETLDLRVRASCTVTTTNALNQLSNLRHLYLPLSFQSNTKDKLKLDRLKKLEILENFHAGKCDAHDLLQLENLQTLTATVDGDNMDLKNTVRGINMQGFLQYSSLVVKNFDSYSEEAISAVATLLESNRVHAVHIEGHLAKFPRLEGIGSNFTEMVFSESELSKDDPMAILGKLPNLVNLVLCNDAFVGKEMVCSASDFPRLECLKLASLQYLEKLTMHGGSRHSMPSLEVLAIEKCPKLETLPSELTHISTLKKIMMGSMAKEFQEIVEEMFNSEEVEVKSYDC